MRKQHISSATAHGKANAAGTKLLQLPASFDLSTQQKAQGRRHRRMSNWVYGRSWAVINLELSEEFGAMCCVCLLCHSMLHPQERRVSCVAMGWLSGCVVVASCSTTGPEPAVMSPAATAAAAAAVSSAAATGLDLTRGAGAGFKCQLLLFPRNHLDFSSVVASTTLHKVCGVPSARSTVCCFGALDGHAVLSLHCTVAKSPAWSAVSLELAL